MIDCLVSRAKPHVLSDGGAVYTRYIIGPSVQACETRKGSCPSIVLSFDVPQQVAQHIGGELALRVCGFS
jgi:hypothetical protein